MEKPGGAAGDSGGFGLTNRRRLAMSFAVPSDAKPAADPTTPIVALGTAGRWRGTGLSATT